MPTSAADGRHWVYERIRDTTADTIVDAGAGEGTYSTLARHLRLDARWVAIEIFEPYVDRFLLTQKYDDVIVGDVNIWQPTTDDYVILFGDVLEHMPRSEAVNLLQFHMQHAAEIMVSIPIVYAPQGAVHGNEHEAHLHHWHWDEMDELLPGAESFKGVMVGRWWWKRLESESDPK